MQNAATVRYTNVQLEPGPVATPFEHRPIGTELALCQRYYQTSDAYALYVYSTTTANRTLNVPRIVEMRALPTTTIGSIAGAATITPAAYSRQNWHFDTVNASGAGGAIAFDIVADAEL